MLASSDYFKWTSNLRKRMYEVEQMLYNHFANHPTLTKEAP